jgi:hypothetical protein
MKNGFLAAQLKSATRGINALQRARVLEEQTCAYTRMVDAA